MLERLKRRRKSTAFAFLLLLGLTVWLSLRGDRHLRKIKDLQQELATNTSLTDDQKKQKRDEIRDQMGRLSESEKDQLRAEGMKRFEDDLRTYAKMTPQEKTQYLDNQINNQEKMRQQFANAKGPQGKGGPLNATSATGGPNGGPKSGDKDQRRKDRLDKSTPEFRALMDQFRKDMDRRRQQRGLPVGNGGGFGR
jgi:hypothetical protein